MIMNGLNHSQVHLINALTMESADIDSSLRSNEETYFKLLELFTPLIPENLTEMRKAVTSSELLNAALSHLATRKHYEDLKSCVAIAPQALLKIIPNTCKPFKHNL
jgi:hypothetical protein